jgi:hypothetical protein
MNFKKDHQFKKITAMPGFVKKTITTTPPPKSQKNLDKKVQKKNKTFSFSTVSKNSKKIKKIRKISFHTSQTGRNLSKLRKSPVLKKKRMSYLEEEDTVYTSGQKYLEKTITQKNDNDIDSEPEIIMMGVKYLHSRLVHSIQKEREIIRRKQNLNKSRRVQNKKKTKKLPEYFHQKTHNFNTPSDRRISVNDRAYLSSIITSQNHSAARRFKVNTSQCTTRSNNSLFLESKNKTSSALWGQSKQKTSMMTMATDSQGKSNSSRKGSGTFGNEILLSGSLGSMFLESPHRKKM